MALEIINVDTLGPHRADRLLDALTATSAVRGNGAKLRDRLVARRLRVESVPSQPEADPALCEMSDRHSSTIA